MLLCNKMSISVRKNDNEEEEEPEITKEKSSEVSPLPSAPRTRFKYVLGTCVASNEFDDGMFQGEISDMYNAKCHMYEVLFEDGDKDDYEKKEITRMIQLFKDNYTTAENDPSASHTESANESESDVVNLPVSTRAKKRKQAAVAAADESVSSRL